MPIAKAEARSGAKPPKEDARRHGTRDRLLDAAEQLFAEHGFDGISLRQIGVATAQGNTGAIQYHFRSKEGLISAVLTRRAKRFELAQQEMLARLVEQGPPWPIPDL